MVKLSKTGEFKLQQMLEAHQKKLGASINQVNLDCYLKSKGSMESFVYCLSPHFKLIKQGEEQAQFRFEWASQQLTKCLETSKGENECIEKLDGIMGSVISKTLREMGLN